jgi:beta-galactosidase
MQIAKKLVSGLMTVAIVAQTFAPVIPFLGISGINKAEAASPKSELSLSQLLAGLTLPNGETIDANELVKFITDNSNLFEGLSKGNFNISDIGGLEDIINGLVGNYRGDIDSALDGIGGDILGKIAEQLGADNNTATYLLSALESIVNEVIGQAKIANTAELRSAIESKIKTIAPKVISGELTADEAKAEVAKEINKLVEKLIAKLGDVVEQKVADELTSYLANLSTDELLNNPLIAGLGNSTITDILNSINDLKTNLNTLSNLSDDGYKDSLVSALNDYIANGTIDCNALSQDSDETDEAFAIRKEACDDAKAIIDNFKNNLSDRSGELDIQKTALAVVAGLTNVVAGATTLLNPELSPEEAIYLAQYESCFDVSGNLDEASLKDDVNFQAEVANKKAARENELLSNTISYQTTLDVCESKAGSLLKSACAGAIKPLFYDCGSKNFLGICNYNGAYKGDQSLDKLNISVGSLNLKTIITNYLKDSVNEASLENEVIAKIENLYQDKKDHENAQNNYNIGGQVIIEPGQTPEEIDSWFRLLNENGMTVCRIRMFEEYLKTKEGTWDFSLFDQAFKAAEKYHIKVFCTLFPSSKNNSVGGFKFPESEAHLKQIANYIEKTVSHFKTFKSTYGWVLINEPGTGGFIPQTEFSKQQFETWKKNQKKSTYNSKNYTLLVNFDNKKFLTDYNTWYLDWLAKEVKKYDATREIHVNNHAIFDNVAEYDFPAWRSILTSLGASAHPSWHFGYFKRSQYTMALAANCEIIRSGAGNLPFWITELQGGNNTYSSQNAFCPTAEETTQWLWTGIGTGAKGIIFWSFNARSIGEEAGEWAMLDFQNKPTDRVIAAKNVIGLLQTNKSLFDQAKPLDSPINILYIRESLWAEKQVQQGNKTDANYEGRLPGGMIKSVTAYFEILAENGIKSNVKEINEFDFTQKDYSGQCIILANQISLPSRYWKPLEQFVQNGGKLIVEGLTAFYDENMLSLNNTGFPLQSLFGGSISEVVCIPGNFEIPYGNTHWAAHLWKSYIYNVSGTPVAQENNHITALRNVYGKGNVVWTPSLLGLGAERTGNKAPLSDFLRQELKEQTGQLPFIFTAPHEGVIMQTLKTGKDYLTVIINKSLSTKNIELTDHFFTPNVLFPEKNTNISRKNINIVPEETLIIHWK